MPVKVVMNSMGQIFESSGSVFEESVPAGFQYKFNPGDYAGGQSYHPTTAQFQADIDSLSSNTTGMLGYMLGLLGSNIVGGSTYDNSVSNAQNGLGNYTGLNTIGAAFNYLLSKFPNARMGILVSWVEIWGKAAPTGGLSGGPMPNFVMNAPSGVLRLPTNFGDPDSGATTWTSYTMTLQNAAFGGGGQYGWGVSSWNGTAGAGATYSYLTPAFWDPCATQVIKLTNQAMAKYVLPAGSPYAGMTLDQCDRIEFVGSNDEVSYAFGNGSDPYTPQGSGVTAPTVANFHTQYIKFATDYAAAFPHTMCAMNVSFGFGSSSGNDATNCMYAFYLPALAAIPGVVICCSDSVATAWVGGQGSGNVQSASSQQSFIGIQVPTQTATLQTPTGTSLVNITPNFAQVQPLDYGVDGHHAQYMPIGITAGTQALVQAICAAWSNASTAKTKPTHRIWWQIDYNFTISSFQSYIRPGLVSGATVNTARPSSLP
jgi:hypothetical protein